MSKLYNTDEPPEGIFPISFELKDRYQLENPFL